jgi:hypothetical protein
MAQRLLGRSPPVCNVEAAAERSLVRWRRATLMMVAITLHNFVASETGHGQGRA